MPRNGSGIFTLPPTNPVVPFTTIATGWANPTMEDIAQALSDSLDRTGRGGMLAPFRIYDGSIGAPGLAFTNEINLGWYRAASGIMVAVSAGTAIAQITNTKLESLTHFAVYGVQTFHYTGTYNWAMYDNSLGDLVIYPSYAINGEVYDSAKGTSINPTTGKVTMPSLNVVGSVTAGSWDVANITCTNLTAADAVNANVVRGAYIESKRFVIVPQVLTGVSGSFGIDFSVSQSWVMELGNNVTISAFYALNVGNVGRLTFSNTTFSVTFPPEVKWPGPSFAKPDFAAGPLKKAVVVIEWDGTHYLANAAVY